MGWPSVEPPAYYKVVVLGEEYVGKTSILKRFVYDKFDTTYEATIGVQFLTKTLRVQDGPKFKLQFWDIGGQKRYSVSSLIPDHLNNSSVAMIVYDIADRISFLSTTKWLEIVRKERGTDVIIVLVGNKTDLVDKRQVSTEEGDDKAREFGGMFIESGAKVGFNIRPLFSKIIDALLGVEINLCREQEGTSDVMKTMVSDAEKEENMEVGDQGPSSMLKRMMEIQKVEGRCQCGRVDDQRSTDMLKRIEDMLYMMKDTHDAKFNRLEETIKKVEGFTRHERLDDIKRWEDMSMRLAEMQVGIFKRLEELHNHKGPIGIVDYGERSNH